MKKLPFTLILRPESELPNVVPGITDSGLDTDPNDNWLDPVTVAPAPIAMDEDITDRFGLVDPELKPTIIL